MMYATSIPARYVSVKRIVADDHLVLTPYSLQAQAVAVDQVVANDMAADTVTAGLVSLAYTASASGGVLAQYVHETSTDSTDWVKVCRLCIIPGLPISGQLQFQVYVKTSGSGTMYYRVRNITKNLDILNGSSTQTVYYSYIANGTINTSIFAGDEIQVDIKADGTNTAYIDSAYVKGTLTYTVKGGTLNWQSDIPP